MRGMSCGVLGLTLLVGCGSQEAGGPPPLETERVTPAPEAAIDPTKDVKGRRVQAASAGVVPGDFPADFPIYRPSSVIQIGTGEGGSRILALRTPDDAASVRSWLEVRLSAAGWRRSGKGWSKGSLSLSVKVEPLPGGSAIRVVY